TYELTGLLSDGTYYIRIWTSDETGNMSALSNAATSYAHGFYRFWVNNYTAAYDSVWADLNNDGYLDAIVANLDSANVYIYRNNGDSTFTQMTSVASNQNRRISPGDYNGDGFLDLLIAKN